MKRLFFPLSVALISGISSPVTAQSFYAVHIQQPGSLNPPTICMLSVDTSVNKTTIIWEKPQNSDITSFNIYREDMIINNYVLIGNVPVDNVSVFTDLNTDPSQRLHRYKISAIDTCGNESDLSSRHSALFLSMPGRPSSSLAWESYRIDNLDYKFNSIVIYRGTEPDNLTAIDTIPGDLNSFVDLDAPEYKWYYCIAGIKEFPCDPDHVPGKKNNQSSYFQTFSNLEDTQWNPPNTVNQNPSPGTISISPNPLLTESTISWENKVNENFVILIYDLKGTLISRIPCPEKRRYSLTRDDLKPGCYIIELQGCKVYHARLFVI